MTRGLVSQVASVDPITGRDLGKMRWIVQIPRLCQIFMGKFRLLLYCSHAIAHINKLYPPVLLSAKLTWNEFVFIEY